MKKPILFVRIVVILIIVFQAVVLAGCNTVNNTAETNSSYDAIKAAYVNDPSNGEISFIYDAINNKISGYPETVPDFINLPVDSIIDAIDTDERIQIQYVDVNDYENGIIIAQEPEAGAVWDDDVNVNLIVNRKYNSINSKNGSMALSLDKLYILFGYFDSDHNKKGSIWADGEELVDGEITTICVDNGNIYYNDSNGVYSLKGESISQVLEKKTTQYAVNNEKIFYRDIEGDGNFYCYNMGDKTNSLIYDEPIMFIYVNSNYIVCHSPHDIIILDNESFKIVKIIHSNNTIISCSLDNDKVYFAEMIFNNSSDQDAKITKYNIKQDALMTIFYTKEMVGDIIAVDDKIVFQHYLDNQIGIRYIDMRDMENKYFSIDDEILNSDDDMIDFLFDGQRIIYEKKDQTFYSICIFTGKLRSQN